MSWSLVHGHGSMRGQGYYGEARVQLAKSLGLPCVRFWAKERGWGAGREGWGARRRNGQERQRKKRLPKMLFLTTGKPGKGREGRASPGAQGQGGCAAGRKVAGEDGVRVRVRGGSVL